jgi:DNA-binding CsgD family transcriptional regulator
MKYLLLYLKPCEKLPRDAYAHLGFYLKNGLISHVVATKHGIRLVSARCEECIFYKLLTSTYVYGTPQISQGRLKVVAVDNRAVRRLVAQHSHQVVKVVEAGPRSLVLTERQKEVLRALADGHNISSTARMESVSKVAVYKTFKTALRKVVALLA